MIRVVAGILVRGDQILICQRSADQTFPLQWEFPGGKIEPGEQPAAALARELEEELGIRAEIGPLVTTVRQDYPNGRSVELNFFRVDRFEGELRNLIFNDVRWVRRAQLPAYDFLEGDLPLVRDIAAGRHI